MSYLRRFIISHVGLTVACCAWLGFAHAGTWHVPAEESTIQAGITAATDGDTVLVADGIHAGPGNRDISFEGKNITVRSSGGPGLCIVDAETLARGFVFENGEGPGARLEGMTITGGFHVSAGGGVYISNASPTIVDCVITSNRTANGTPGILNTPGGDGGHGGGVFVSGGSPVFEDCDISDNIAGTGGDGFVNGAGAGGSVGGNGGHGGGLYIEGGATVTLSRCIVSGNVSGAGGTGGSSVICVPPLSCQTFGEDGGDAGHGGGLAADGSIVQAHDCLFSDNSTDEGGAAGFGIDPPLPGPGAGGDGGAWYGGVAGSWVINCTITGNTAAEMGQAGQPAGFGGGIEGVADVTNSIVWGNNSQQISPALQVKFSDVQGGYPGNGNIDSDPLFIGANDARLQAGSPCVEAGSIGDVVHATDLDGEARVVDGDFNGVADVDMGAYEGRFTATDVSGAGSENVDTIAARETPNGVTVRYSIAPPGGAYQIVVYDVTGRLLKVLERGSRSPGTYEVSWRRSDAAGRAVPRGLYFLELRTHQHAQERRAAYKLVVIGR